MMSHSTRIKNFYLTFTRVALMILVLGHSKGFAQEAIPNSEVQSNWVGRNELAATYIVAFPTAGTRDFISNVSFAGVGLEWGHYVSQQLSFGISTRWNRLYQEDDRQTYQVDNAAITGKQYKAINVFPIFPKVKFDFEGQNSSLVPYLQLGLGPIYGQKYRTVGNFTYNNFGWQFGFGPEVGLIWRSTYKTLGALFSVRYDVGLGTDAFPAYSAFNLSLGIHNSI